MCVVGSSLQCLGDQEAVERVAVMIRQSLCAADFMQFKGDLPEAVIGHEGSGKIFGRSLQLQLADPSLNRDLPDRDETEKNFVITRMENGLPFLAR